LLFFANICKGSHFAPSKKGEKQHLGSKKLIQTKKKYQTKNNLSHRIFGLFLYMMKKESVLKGRKAYFGNKKERKIRRLNEN
jgi:hypothetical protein